MVTHDADASGFTPLDERVPATVRAVILARSSEHISKPEDVREQVFQCRDFIAAMGWPPVAVDWPEVPDARVFTEGKSGMRNVERKVTDAVLALAARGEIDVVVCREWERVSRRSARRHQIIMTAEDFGVEFRFANLAATKGKMPDTLESRITRAVIEELGQAEAEKIVERLTPPRLRRHVEGLPHSGPNGPLYGYAPGERYIGKHGKPMGLLTWVIHEDKAEWVHWLFDTIDSLIPADVSLRRLAGELERRGVPTSTGKGRWSEMQVKRILTNPKYCGEGRNMRWFVQWRKKKNPRTGKWPDKAKVHDRMRDPEAWETETHKVAADAIPPIITPEQFHRVQDKLAAAAKLKNKGGPRRTDLAATSTLLDGDFVRCAECGGKMTRYWKTNTPRPQYECNRGAGVPTHPHKSHHIDAPAVDCLALCLLAKALTDPQKILELATAAEAQITTAETDSALAAAAQSAYEKRLANIQQQQNNLLAGLGALSKVPGMEQQVIDIRTQLAKLGREQKEAEAERAGTLPVREHAAERAAFLRQLFTVRDHYFNFTAGTRGETGDPHLKIGWPGVRAGDDGERIRTSSLPLYQAAALLGMPESELGALGLSIQWGEPFTYRLDDDTWAQDETVDTVDTADVIHLLLKRMSRDQVRKLLDALEVRVKVTRPWTPEQRRARGGGFTPVWARVSLTILGAVEVRADATQALICA